MATCNIDKKIVNWELIKEETKTKERPKKIQYVMAPKRPQEIECDIHHVSYKGQKWIMLVGLLDGDPYEIFLGQSEKISLPKKCSKGKIEKKKKGQYDLHIAFDDEELVLKDILKLFDNPELAWASRLVSMSLRHGVRIEFVVEQMSKDGNIIDINKVIARVLKTYIKEKEMLSSIVCPDCQSSHVVYEAGCLKCLDCGHSKCG